MATSLGRNADKGLKCTDRVTYNAAPLARHLDLPREATSPKLRYREFA
jgi:hypothetical protein